MEDKGKILQNTYLPLFVLVIVPWLMYWRTTGYEFVWDDISLHIVKNPYLNPFDFDHFVALWKEPYRGLYIPMAYSVWGGIKSATIWLFTDHKTGFLFHLANIVLHSLNGIMVFILLKNFVKSRWAAFAGALLFLTHPVQVESVAWVSEFRGLGAAFFGFLAVYYYLKACKVYYNQADQKAFIFYFSLNWILFLCAILFKPSALVVPLFALLFEYYLFANFKKLKSFVGIALMMLPAATIILITTSVQESSEACPFWAKPLIWMDAVTFYLYKLCVPLSLGASYARTPSYVMMQSWFYVIWIIPVAAGGVILYFRKKHPVILPAALFFIIGFLPVSGLMEFTFQQWSTTADRYLYLSMFGVALFFAYIADKWRQNWQKGLVLAVIVFWAGWCTMVQIPVWKDNLHLWSHCIRVTPREEIAYNNRGEVYLNKNQFEKALSDFNKAISLAPGFAGAYSNKGMIYSKKKEYDKAVLAFNKAISINSKLQEGYNNRGIIYMDIKEFDKALSDFHKAVELNPDEAICHNNLGNAYKELHQFDKALLEYDEAVLLNPEYFEAYHNKGELFFNENMYEKSIVSFTKAIYYNPGYVSAYFKRGVAFQKIKHLEKAIADYSQVILKNKNHKTAYLNRGAVFQTQKKYDKALSDFNKVISLDPENENAYYNKGVILIHKKEYKKAVSAFTRAIQIMPDSYETYFHRGNAYQVIKEYSKAVKDYNKAILLNNKNPALFNNRASALFQQKEYKKAIEDIEKVKKLGGKANAKLVNLLKSYMTN